MAQPKGYAAVILFPHLKMIPLLGVVYVFAVLDWASRRVLAWRLSNCAGVLQLGGWG
jgi:hypothetical protein